MDFLLSVITADASACGVAPTFLGPFARSLQAEFSTRVQQTILPVLSDHHDRFKKAAAAATGMFDAASKSKFAANLCAFFELDKEFDASVPYQWYLTQFKARARDYLAIDEVQNACKEVLADWDTYNSRLFVSLGADERRAIQLEEELHRFTDVFQHINVGEIFSNRYVSRVRVSAVFNGFMTSACPTLGYPVGPWIPPVGDVNRKALDKEVMPRRGDMLSFATNIVQTLTRQFVCKQLYDLASGSWARDCDKYFYCASKHADMAEHLASAKAIDRETEQDLHALLFNPRTSSLKFGKEDDGAYGLVELQPHYATVRAALVRAYALTFTQPLQPSSPSSSSSSSSSPDQQQQKKHASLVIPISPEVHQSLEKCGHTVLRDAITAFRAHMNEKRRVEYLKSEPVHPNAVRVTWLRMRGSAVVTSTPVSKDALHAFAKRSLEFTDSLYHNLLKAAPEARFVLGVIEKSLQKLEKIEMVSLRDILDHMVEEVRWLWRAYELADTLEAQSALLPPPPPPRGHQAALG